MRGLRTTWFGIGTGLRQAFADPLRTLTLAISLGFLASALVGAAVVTRLAFVLLDEMRAAVTLTIYLDPGADGAAVAERLASDGRARSVTLTAPEDALAKLRASSASAAQALATLEENPLPASIEVTGYDTAGLAELRVIATAIPEVGEVITEEALLQEVQDLSRLALLLGAAIFAGAFITVLIVVRTTMRLSVSARATEIAVLRLLGARDGQIYLPFTCEALVVGVLGCLIAGGLWAAVIQGALSQGWSAARLGLTEDFALVAGAGLLGSMLGLAAFAARSAARAHVRAVR